MDWKKEMLYATVIYKIAEMDERIPYLTFGTEYEFIDKDLHEMARHGLIEHRVVEGETVWVTAQKGIELRNKLVAMYDQMLQFEIFSDVNLSIDVTDFDPEGEELDPRFEAPADPVQADDWGTEDMRLAVMNFMADGMGDGMGLDHNGIVTGKHKSID